MEKKKRKKQMRELDWLTEFSDSEIPQEMHKNDGGAEGHGCFVSWHSPLFTCCFSDHNSHINMFSQAAF